MTRISYRYHASPIGPLLLVASERGLRALYMGGHRHAPDEPDPGWRPASPGDAAAFAILAEAGAQLDQYFAGERPAFELPLDVDGTPFQQGVWSALRAIGYGETLSYGELARRIGNPNAVRAVGLANGRNPLSIVVPCHRVIGADGSMTGYGGGLARKVFLLALERRVLQEAAAPRATDGRATAARSGDASRGSGF